jgi:hypothetical protein
VKKAPFLLYIIAFIFLCLSVVHFLSLAMILRSWTWLRVFEINPGTGILFFANLFFGLGFLLAGFFLLLRRTWAYGFGGILSMLATAWFWVGRTVLSQSPLPFARQVFLLILSIILLVLVLLSLWLLAAHLKPEPPISNLVENDHESKN